MAKRRVTVKTSSTKLDLHVDRSLKKRWGRALTTLESARRQGATAFDELWETVAEIVDHDPPLYLAGGFATTKAFLTKHLKESERTARRLMRVAKFASPNEEARYGVSKLDAALAWLEAKAGKPRGRLPVDFPKLRVPVKGGPTLPFDEATVRDLTAATRELLRAGKPRKNRPPLVRALATAIAKKGKSLDGITVSLTNGKLTLGNILPDQLAALTKALGSAKLP